jgi:hypothetical protein
MDVRDRPGAGQARGEMLATIHRAGFARRPREAEIGVVWREERPGAAGPQQVRSRCLVAEGRTCQECRMSGTPEQVGSRAMLAAGNRSAGSVAHGERGEDLWRPAEAAAAALGAAIHVWHRACHGSSSVSELRCWPSARDSRGDAERQRSRWC